MSAPARKAMIRARPRARRWGLPVAFAFASTVLASPSVALADEWWGTDKALHFGVSAGIAGAGYAASAVWLEEPWQRAVVGGTVAVALGAAKELVDLTGAGDPSWKDFTWDVIGAATGVGVALAIDFAVRPKGPAPQSVSFPLGVVRF